MDPVGRALDMRSRESVHILNKRDRSQNPLTSIDFESVFDDRLQTMTADWIKHRNVQLEEILRRSLDDHILRRGILEVEYAYLDDDGYFFGSIIELSLNVPQGELHTHKSGFGTTSQQALARWNELNQKEDDE